MSWVLFLELMELQIFKKEYYKKNWVLSYNFLASHRYAELPRRIVNNNEEFNFLGFILWKETNDI